MEQLLLVATIAGREIALPSNEVQSVIQLGPLTPVPRAPERVAGLAALRSQILTVIDCRKSLGLDQDGDAEAVRHAVVIEIGGHHYALQVERVADVIPALSEPAPLRADLGRGWGAAALGMVETARGPLLLLDPGAIIFGPSRSAAWAA